MSRADREKLTQDMLDRIDRVVSGHEHQHSTEHGLPVIAAENLGISGADCAPIYFGNCVSSDLTDIGGGYQAAVAVRQGQHVIGAEAFGLSETNTAEQNDAALQRAYEHAIATGANTIHIPAGEFTITRLGSPCAGTARTSTFIGPFSATMNPE